jgi:hypothetical protein
MASKTNDSVKNPHDAAFKSAFGNPELARAFFRDYLPEEVRRHIDLNHLRPVERSFVDETLKDRHADLAYETRLKDRLAFLYLLFEHQSSPDPWMAFRLLQYILALWLDFRKQHPEATRLPAVIPMVLYHGKRPWNGPIRFREMVDAPDDLAPFIPDFRYRLLDLGVLPDKLSAFGREVRVRARLYLFRHIWEPDFWERFGETADMLVQGEEYILMDYLRWALRYGLHGRDEDPETARKMIERETRRIGNETIRRMAMNTAERIRQEGKNDGIVSLLKSQLEGRFGDIPNSLQKKLLQADPETLNRFGVALFQFQSVDQAEKWWKQTEGRA